MGKLDGNRPPAGARRVALVATGGAPAAKALLADIVEALPVYAGLAGVAAPDVVRVASGHAGADCDATLLVLGAEGSPELGGLAPGTRAYALLCLEGRGPADAGEALLGVRRACTEEGLSWQGGLVVSGAEHLPRLMRTPRMGWARRRVSEATDRLLMALLAGRPLPPQLARPSRLATVAAGLCAMMARATR